MEPVKRKPTKPQVNVSLSLDDDDFGAVLNCAVRYSIGRQTYMPGLVIDFITPLIPFLNDKTLWCFDQDTTDAKWVGGYGNPNIDEPKWLKFREDVRREREKRGHELYRSWREDDTHEKSLQSDKERNRT